MWRFCGTSRRRSCWWCLSWALALWAGVTFDGPTVHASAWNAPQGQGLLAVDYTFDGGAHYFNGQGKLSPAAAYRKQELYGYLEYGVTDWLMAIVKPDLAAITATAPDGSAHHYSGLGTSEVAAQLRVLAYGPAVLAVAGGFRLPGTTAQNNYALIGNTSRDADLRALGGVALPFGPFPMFVDLEAGYRFRSGGAPAEWHGDLTLGARPLPRFLILLQSFNTIPEGAGTPWFPASRYSKLGLSFVYDLSAAWSVEIGAFETVGGTDALRERGITTGLWRRF